MKLSRVLMLALFHMVVFGSKGMTYAETIQYSVATIDIPGNTSSPSFGLNDINDAGQIVGTSANPAGREHGFLDSGGTFTAIDVPGADYTFASGLMMAARSWGLTAASMA